MLDSREVLEFVGGPYDGLLRLAPLGFSSHWMTPGLDYLYLPGVCIGYCMGPDRRWYWFSRG